MFRILFVTLLLCMMGCDGSRIYETNIDFNSAQWPLSDTLTFDFNVPDSTSKYNVILNVRNTIDFKTARLFVQYELLDSGKTLRKRLIEENLFDRKTGEPFGDSGLGNIYTHQFLLEPGIALFNNHQYRVKLNHMMRYDTLEEIRSIGIRVERGIK